MFSSLLVSVILLMGLSGCGGGGGLFLPVQVADTACAPNVAQIQVGDGFFRILCGCTAAGESSGSLFSSSTRLTCHLPTQDSRVYFFFLNNVQPHQIVGQNPSSFIPSTVVDPSAGMTQWVHVVQFPQASSTYPFQDVFSGITGTIFVPWFCCRGGMICLSRILGAFRS